jgi:SAM-dependent methyltransferase
MHFTSLRSGESFSETYGGADKIVVDIGGQDVNGSLRNFFTEKGMKFMCVDMIEHPSVDIVVKPGDKLPFDNSSVDLIVSTSCFEHDPCFWLTFKEMTRIIKLDGYIYINAPTAGPYHCYPGDNWRFYSDAGQALAYWSGKQVINEEVYPVKVVETFNVVGEIWNDFVCVWTRTENKETEILVNTDILNTIGKLEKSINDKGLATRKKC